MHKIPKILTLHLTSAEEKKCKEHFTYRKGSSVLSAAPPLAQRINKEMVVTLKAAMSYPAPKI